MVERTLIRTHVEERIKLLYTLWHSKIYTKNTSKLNLLTTLKYKKIICLDGLLYFVEGGGLGSEFGFPRVEGKKKFRWKKMNFTTDLPKKNP